MQVQIYIRKSTESNKYEFYSETDFSLVPNIGDKISIDLTNKKSVFKVEDKIIYPSKVLVYCEKLYSL